MSDCDETLLRYLYLTVGAAFGLGLIAGGGLVLLWLRREARQVRAIRRLRGVESIGEDY